MPNERHAVLISVGIECVHHTGDVCDPEIVREAVETALADITDVWMEDPENEDESSYTLNVADVSLAADADA